MFACLVSSFRENVHSVAFTESRQVSCVVCCFGSWSAPRRATMRDDVTTVRISMSEAPAHLGSPSNNASHFTTTFETNFANKLRPGLAGNPTAIHKVRAT